MGITSRHSNAYQPGGDEPSSVRVAAPVAVGGRGLALPKVAPFGKPGPEPRTDGTGATGTTGPRSGR